MRWHSGGHMAEGINSAASRRSASNRAPLRRSNYRPSSQPPAAQNAESDATGSAGGGNRRSAAYHAGHQFEMLGDVRRNEARPRDSLGIKDCDLIPIPRVAVPFVDRCAATAGVDRDRRATGIAVTVENDSVSNAGNVGGLNRRAARGDQLNLHFPGFVAVSKPPDYMVPANLQPEEDAIHGEDCPSHQFRHRHIANAETPLPECPGRFCLPRA